MSNKTQSLQLYFKEFQTTHFKNDDAAPLAGIQELSTADLDFIAGGDRDLCIAVTTIVGAGMGAVLGGGVGGLVGGALGAWYGTKVCRK